MSRPLPKKSKMSLDVLRINRVVRLLRYGDIGARLPNEATMLFRAM